MTYDEYAYNIRLGNFEFFVLLYSLAIEEERARMQALQQELKKEKSHVKKLKTALDDERTKGKMKDRELEVCKNCIFSLV